MPRTIADIILKAEDLLDKKKRRLAEEGENFALKLSIHSLEQHVQDLKEKLKVEQKSSR